MKLKQYLDNLELEECNVNISEFLDRTPYHFYDMKKEDMENDVKNFKKYEILGKKYFLFFFSIPNKWNHVYVGLYDTPPFLWHKITSAEEMRSTLFTYNITFGNVNNIGEDDDVENEKEEKPTKGKKPKKKSKTTESENESKTNENDENVEIVEKVKMYHTIVRGYIGNVDDDLSIPIFEKLAYIHPLIVPMPWGKQCKPDFSVLNENNPLTISAYLDSLLEENEDEPMDEINFVTKFSRSIISITTLDELVFLQIKYCYVGKNEYPADVKGILHVFPKVMTHNDLLDMDPPMIQVALTTASNITDFLDEIYVKLVDMYENKFDTYPKETQKILHDNYAKLTINKQIFTELEKLGETKKKINKAQLVKQIKKACKGKNFKDELVNKHIDYIFEELSK